jgi:hypothetical protein
VYWKQGAWPLAGAALERSLAGRWTSDRALSGGEEARLLKSAGGLQPRDDQGSLARLRAATIANRHRTLARRAAGGPFNGVDDERLTRPT